MVTIPIVCSPYPNEATPRKNGITLKINADLRFDVDIIIELIINQIPQIIGIKSSDILSPIYIFVWTKPKTIIASPTVINIVSSDMLFP